MERRVKTFFDKKRSAIFLLIKPNVEKLTRDQLYKPNYTNNNNSTQYNDTKPSLSKISYSGVGEIAQK